MGKINDLFGLVIFPHFILIVFLFYCFYLTLNQRYLRGEPGTSENETNEMFVKNDIESNGEKYVANSDETNIFLKMSKVSKRSRPDNKARRCKEGTAKSNATEDTKPKKCTCDCCGEIFESRTKLFAHLRNSGHATLKSLPVTSSAKTKTNRIKKK